MRNKKFKDIFINLGLFLTSLFLIALLEIYLRHIHYGFDNSLFIVEDIQKGKPFYYLNARLKEKYQFTNEYVVFDPIFPDQMKYKKGEKDFRVFCMGGSTTQGYPHFINGSFPVFLEGMLSLAKQKKDIEVVNLGVTAMNSYGVLDFMKMVPHYEPDLIVIYMGHNEFFGALGSASNLFLGYNRNTVHFFLKLQEFKIYLLARNIYYRIKKYFKKPEPLNSTLMQEIVRIKEIPVKSELREKTYANFEENLKDILSIAKKNNIPVVIGTVVCNLKDFQPFNSEDYKGLSMSQEFLQFLKDGQKAFEEEEYDKAITFYEKAKNIFPENAQVRFQLAKAHLAKGQKEKALTFFRESKDLDIIPFRAPGEINKIIRKEALAFGAKLVDLDNLMNKAEKGNILGKPDLLEHLHPSFSGNYKIAAHFADAIFQESFLETEENIDWHERYIVEKIKEHAGFTGLDIYAANYKVRALIKEWPYNINNSDFQPPFLETDLGGLKIPSPRGKINLIDLAKMHFQIGIAYYKKSDFIRSFKELNAASKIDIFNDQVFAYKASALLKLERIAEADTAVRKAIDLNPQNALAYRLKAYMGLKQGKVLQAKEDMKTYLTLEPKDFFVHYELAKLLLQEGDKESALFHLKRVEKMQKGYKDAASLIKNIEISINKK